MKYKSELIKELRAECKVELLKKAYANERFKELEN